jgi:pimeloyl-ACP methyl ester carboxylesterase
MRLLSCLLVATVVWLGGFRDAPAQAAAPAPAAEDWQLTTPTGVLHGTLLLPRGIGKVPVVLIHPGSGPTDRDGNSPLLPGKNNSLRLLAEGLASRRIASLRIDKRGVAGSAAAATAESDLRVETFADDAASWLDLLKRDPRFTAIVALGHSEGALITALAAARRPVNGYVSVAGVAQRASEVLRRQLQGKLNARLMAESERILSALERGVRADSVPAELFPLFRPSVQPYLISWFRISPAETVGRLGAPVLVAQGTTDLQVDTLHAALLLARRPDARYLKIAGMNHVLKQVSGELEDQVASYGDSTLMVTPALLDGLADFVRGLPPADAKSSR